MSRVVVVVVVVVVVDIDFYIAIYQVSLLSHAACAITIAGFGSSW